MPARKKTTTEEQTVVQTDLEKQPESEDEREFPIQDQPDTAVPYTDSENDPEEPRAQDILQDIPQTDSETDEMQEDTHNPSQYGKDTDPIPKTDSETPDMQEELPDATHLDKPSEPILQTETEEAARPRRRRSRAATVETQSEGEAAEPAPSEPRRRRTRSNLNIVSIDESRSVETEEDKARNDLIDLLESQKSGRILTGTIQGVENTTDNPPNSLAVIYHGNFKVIIPAEEAVLPPDDLRGRSLSEIMHYLITKRLGAEVDYIVKGIDVQAGIAVASRLEAMRSKRRQYYFGTDRDGNNLLYSGVCAEARVVSVIRAGVFIDLCGLETYIPLRELSYQRMMDAASQYRPGQRILVKILDIDRSDRDNIRVTASVKQAGENPYEKALRRYSIGDCYVGTVSMVDTTGVFVALDGGIDCLCSYPKRGRPPRGARVTVRILGINFDSNRIWGAITHIAAAR